ncbi:MAG: hypothetical protein U1E29_18390 [Coriobacteriia bacterium]|nr:hypothetical protein [Coriobacteriia bacterium]
MMTETERHCHRIASRAFRRRHGAVECPNRRDDTVSLVDFAALDRLRGERARVSLMADCGLDGAVWHRIRERGRCMSITSERLADALGVHESAFVTGTVPFRGEA